MGKGLNFQPYETEAFKKRHRRLSAKRVGVILIGVVIVEFGLALLGSPHLRLVGMEDGRFAIFENMESGEQELFDLGQAVFGNGVLVQITPEFVVIEENGTRRKIKRKQAIQLVEDGEMIREGTRVNRFDKMGDMKHVPQSILAAVPTPVVENGTIIGFSLKRITPSSFLAHAGLKNGDTITAINGESITGSFDALDKIRTSKGDTVDISVKRGDEQLTLQF